jgi:hypothetical protein
MDLQLVETFTLRGMTHVQIAQEISKQRKYSLSRQQVSLDCCKLTRQYEQAALESFSQQRARALRKLDLTEFEAWSAWDKSKGKKEPGDPQFLRVILETHAHRARLGGWEAPTRTEISGPSGGPVEVTAAMPLDPQQKLELLKRHVQRLEDAAKTCVKIELPAAPVSAPAGAT